MCNKEKFWPLLCNALGRAEWATDARFRTFKDRLAHRDLLTWLLDSAFMAPPTDKWIEKLSGIVPVSPVLDIGAGTDEPIRARARRHRQAFDRSDGSAARLLTNPIRLPGTSCPTRAAPALGADNLQLLREAGFSMDEIKTLRDKRVIAGATTDVEG